MRKGSLCVCAFVMGSLFIVGCGGGQVKRNAVTGSVKFKSEPVKYGSINFRSTGDGKYVGSVDIKDGKYEMLEQVGLPAGSYNVAITYPDPKIPAPKGDEPPGVALPKREMLPEKYNNKSELKAEIKDGNNTVDFDLK